MTDCSGNKTDLSNNQTDCSGNKIDMSNNNTKCTSSPSSCSDTNLFIKSSDCSSSYKNNNCCSTTNDDCCETSEPCSSYICSDSDFFCKKPGIDFSIGNKKCKKYKEGCKNVRCKINHHDSYVVNERKLINSMIDKYHNPNSICLKDNRIILKKLIPIYHDLIDITHSYIDKVHKLKFNLNPSKSSKIFRIVFDSFKTLTLNYYRSFTSILNVRYKGYDVLDFTMNNVVSSDRNCIKYASCNNYYETNGCLDKSILFYSVPGLTLLFNNETLSFRVIAKKSNFNNNCRVFKYDFLLVPGTLSNCNRINKCYFLKIFESISDFKQDKGNNLLEFINFLYHEENNIKSLL